MSETPPVQILGVPFFRGSEKDAVDRMLTQRGLLTVPAAPALRTIATDIAYRDALLESDMVIPDSAYMTLVWNLVGRPKLRRVSGLGYLSEMLTRKEAREAGNTFWVMAGEKSARTNLNWLRQHGVSIPDTHWYNAPMYMGGELADLELLEKLERLKPPHIVLTLGGGTQERLGLYLKKSLSYQPGIHCIGAAIAFLSGDQVNIPMWADRFYLGWLFRSLRAPRRFFPRYWNAIGLAQLIYRYRSQLPPIAGDATKP